MPPLPLWAFMVCSRVNFTKRKALLFIGCKQKTKGYNLETMAALLSAMFYAHSLDKSSEDCL